MNTKIAYTLQRACLCHNNTRYFILILNKISYTSWHILCRIVMMFIASFNLLGGYIFFEIALNWKWLLQGWKLQNISAFLSEKCRKNLPVRCYFCLCWTGRQTAISSISAFPLEKCLNFLLVQLYFYLSWTGGQPVISIPGLLGYTRDASLIYVYYFWLKDFLVSYSCLLNTIRTDRNTAFVFTSGSASNRIANKWICTHYKNTKQKICTGNLKPQKFK